MLRNLLVCQARATVHHSGPHCCVCVMSSGCEDTLIMCSLTPTLAELVHLKHHQETDCFHWLHAGS